jgi:hypothetical protein
MLKYKFDDVVKATVTKSKPGQDVGLSIEERYHRVYVTDVTGLFKENNVPVHPEDQLLEVNGMSVANKAAFPNGVEDIKRFLKGEWNVFVKVRKGGDSEDNRDDDTIQDLAAYNSFKQIRRRFSNPSSDSEDSTIANSDEDNNCGTEPLRRERSPERIRARNVRERSKSPSPFGASEKRRRNRKPRSMRKKTLDDTESISENTDTTFSLSEDDFTLPRTDTRTCQTGTLLSIEEDEGSTCLSPLTPANVTKQPSIKSISGSSHRITVEMNNGQSVSVTPEQLLKVVSSHSLEAIEAPSVYTPKKKKSKGKLKDKKKKHSSTKEMKKKSKRAPRRKSTGYLRKPEKDEDFVRDDLHLSFKSSQRSMDSSTHSCMTNLIDPGDLMKIHGFRSKPEMNGMTVEVVRKSKGSKGKRWDARVITEKNVKIHTSFKSKRLISVSTGNLRHFM